MCYSIEVMAAADFDEVLELWKGTEGVGLNESDSQENIAIFLDRNPGLSRVVRWNSRIIAAVLCGHDGRRGYLHHLAVAKSHRNKGIAKQLVNSCAEALAKLGLTKCNIFVYAHNHDGQSFWQHNDWSTREDLRVMQKKLTG